MWPVQLYFWSAITAIPDPWNSSMQNVNRSFSRGRSKEQWLGFFLLEISRACEICSMDIICCLSKPRMLHRFFCCLTGWIFTSRFLNGAAYLKNVNELPDFWPDHRWKEKGYRPSNRQLRMVDGRWELGGGLVVTGSVLSMLHKHQFSLGIKAAFLAHFQEKWTSWNILFRKTDFSNVLFKKERQTVWWRLQSACFFWQEV